MRIRKGHWPKYLLFSALSIIAAFGNMGVVFLVNRIISDYFSNKPVIVGKYLLYFSVTLSVFFVSRWIVSIGIIRFTQKLLRTTRMEVFGMVLKFPFYPLVSNKERIYTALTRDTDNIVNASINLVDILTNIVVVLICFTYMGALSWKLLLCMLCLVTFTLFIYFLSERRAQQLFAKAMMQNDIFVKYLNEVLSGFKEIAIERNKGYEIASRHVSKAIDSASHLNQKAHVNYLNNRIVGQIAFYTFIALLLLFFGDAFSISRSVIVNFIFLVLYTWGPIETIVILIPVLSQARISMGRINEMEKIMVENEFEKDPDDRIHSFRDIELKQISFSYEREKGPDSPEPFGIGPIDFAVGNGEIVFISGGNGSGKSTLVNVLTGLFDPGGGNIYVNGEEVDRSALPVYRSLFAPVFSDFHLFDEFYGIADPDPAKIERYLRLFELEKKVVLDGKKFSTTDLSAGQRKRLALICAMLEKKPVIILDEFAAEQDPYFKRKFYNEVLDFLKKEGFTVVAITHDDAYYSVADRLYKMDSGRLVELTPGKVFSSIDYVA